MGNETLMMHESALELSVDETPSESAGESPQSTLARSDESDSLKSTDDEAVLSEGYTVKKIPLNSTVNVGEQVTFRIIVQNNGEVDIEGMEVVEHPDESLIFDHWYCDGEKWGNEGPTHYYLWEPIAPGGYSEFFVVYNTTKVGNITNSITVDGETFNATVEVLNETDNETDDGENITDDVIIEPPVPSVEPIIGKGIWSVPATSEDSVSKQIDKNATGNPILALFVVLISLVLIRRRNG